MRKSPIWIGSDMFDPKIKLDKALYERLSQVSEKAGYSSVDEFVKTIIEKELEKLEGGGDEDDAALQERLRGLGYIE